jgi:hypothetical protein
MSGKCGATNPTQPRTIVGRVPPKPGDSVVPDRLVVGIVLGAAGTDLAEPHDVVPGSRNRIADRAPHLPDPVQDMHRPVLVIEAGRVVAVAIVELADGFDPNIRRLQPNAPAGDAPVIAHGVVPVPDLMHIAASGKARACRYADRTRRIGRAEPGPPFGQSIDVGCSDDRMTGA